MLDTDAALADMAQQVRSCRVAEGMTLQQLASRSSVAASTIHKVESQQMVPTVSVLLKIAKGLGRRADELVRDDAVVMVHNGAGSAEDSPNRAGVWRIDLAANQSMPSMELEPVQRAIVLVEKGAVDLRSGERSVHLDAGDCYEFGGGCRIDSHGRQHDPASVTVIVSPPGDLGRSLEAAGTTTHAANSPGPGQ